MKKAFSNILLLTLGLLVTSCAPNENKANKLIREWMSNANYDSYDAVKTTVTKAKASMYTDTACWNEAFNLYVIMDKVLVSKRKAEKAEEMRKNYSSLPYSDDYYKYDSEYRMELFNYETMLPMAKYHITKLKDKLSQLDEETIVGWEVNHSFNYISEDGRPIIGNYRFVIDKDFTQILIEEDLDSKESFELRHIVPDMIR